MDSIAHSCIVSYTSVPVHCPLPRSGSSLIAPRSQPFNHHSSRLCCVPWIAPAYHHLNANQALILAFVLILACYVGFRMKINAHTAELPPGETLEPKSCNAPASAKIDFATQIRPIFESSCQPCHFNGGTMYQRLPFDRPETIKSLGTKLFTRIQDENKRRLIREFLSQE